MKLTIDQLVYGGYGLGRAEGKAVLVPYSAPGDEIEATVTTPHRRYDEAVITKIVKPAPVRIIPECQYYGVCGGCHLQHMNYAAQLLWKQKILEEQLSHFGGIKDPNVLPTIASPKVWGYRRRIQVHKKGSHIGYYERSSERIVDVDFCPIASDTLNRKLAEVRKNWPVSGDKVDLSEEDAASFSQVNTGANEKLKELIVEWSREGLSDSAIELYAGSGNLTFALAKVAGKITAVEREKAAVLLAAKTIKEEKIKNVELVPSSAERFLGLSRLKSVDLLLVDPPREGLSREVLREIVRMKPRRVIYASCDPATLSRDVNTLVKQGYRFVRAQALDMFPQTYHIESVTELLFEGKVLAEPREIGRDRGFG